MDALQIEDFTQIRFAIWFEPISGKKNMRKMEKWQNGRRGQGLPFILSSFSYHSMLLLSSLIHIIVERLKPHIHVHALCLTMADISKERMEDELERVRKELDEMTKMKNQQELMANQASALTKSLMTQVEQLQKELKEAQDERDKVKDDAQRLGGMRQMIESQFQEVAEHCQLLLDEKNRLEEENKELKLKVEESANIK